MPEYRKILRLYNQGINKTSIAQACRCSRTTVSRILQDVQKKSLTWDQIEHMTERELQELINRTPSSLLMKKRPNFELIRKELFKSGVTMSLLWNEYYDQSLQEGVEPLRYSQFCHLYRNFAKAHDATMHMTHRPGEVVEVDWAGDPLYMVDPLTGELLPVSLFVAVLPYSQYCFARGFLTQSEESWIQAHIMMYDYFGGVTKLLVPDNLKTGITKHVVDEVIVQRTYQELADHYGTVVIPTRVRAPKDKASVERSVGILSTWIIASLRNQKFFSLEELNQCVRSKLDEFNTKEFQKREGNRYQIFLQEEKDYLLPLPQQAYDFATWKVSIVPLNYHICIEKMHYSVPYEYIKQTVDVRVSMTTIEVFFKDQRIASHPRIRGKINQFQTNVEHMPDHHRSYREWNKEKFMDWALNVGEWTHRTMESIFLGKAIEQQAYRTALALLKLADKYSLTRLEKSCEIACAYTTQPTYQHVKTILQSGRDKTYTAQPQPKHKKVPSHSFVRGAAYYGGLKHD